MAVLGVDYVWLNWLEAIYRVPDLFSFSDLNSSSANLQCDPMLPLLRQWLVDLSAAYPRAKIVVPLSVGGHRDHWVTCQAAFDVLDHATLLCFEDFPYVAYLPEQAKELAKSYDLVPLEVDISPYVEQRVQAAGCYQSQHAMLFYPASSFGDVIGEYACRGGRERCVERYWRFA